MNWISIALNAVSTHKHTHARDEDFTLNLSHTDRVSQGYLRPARHCTAGGGIVSAQEKEGESMRERGGAERRKRVRRRAEESQQAVGVEVIMRHWSEPRRWHDEIHELCLCWSLSHCLLLLSAPLSLTVSFDWCFVLSRPIFTTFQDFPDFVLSFSFSVVRSLFFFSLCCYRSFFLLHYFSVSCHCCMF